MSELVATLEAELKQAEAFKGMLAKDNRGAANVLRAKDKELDGAKLQAAEAISSNMRCKVYALLVWSVECAVRIGSEAGSSHKFLSVFLHDNQSSASA